CAVTGYERSLHVAQVSTTEPAWVAGRVVVSVLASMPSSSEMTLVAAGPTAVSAQPVSAANTISSLRIFMASVAVIHGRQFNAHGGVWQPNWAPTGAGTAMPWECVDCALRTEFPRKLPWLVIVKS